MAMTNRVEFEFERVARVADWVRDNLHQMEQESLSPVPAAEFVRLGDDQILIHAPGGRSFLSDRHRDH